MGAERTAAEELAQLRQENEKLRAEVAHLRLERDALVQRLKAELKKRYGRQSERFDGQGLLPFMEDESVPPAPPHIDEAPDEEYETVRRKKKKRSRGAPRFPDDLQRRRVHVEPSAEEAICPCCGKTRIQIGEDVTEELDYVPASFEIVEYVRPRLVCPDHEEAGVTIPDLPPRPIEKGMAGPGLLAQVVTAKYRDHLPLYRQSGIYKRSGVEISDSTMGDWIRDMAHLLSPIVAEMKRQALTTGYVASDDTRITILDRTHHKGSRKGYLWVYQGSELGDCIFDYRPNRSRDGPLEFLRGYEGYVQADAYSGYDRLFTEGNVKEVGCMAHARRRFDKAIGDDPKAARGVMDAIRRLYGLESYAKKEDLSVAALRDLRQAEALPLLEKLRDWMLEYKPHVLPESPMGDALGYFLNHAEALIRYTEDGRLAIDNNRAERAMRQVAVGRKNWMFAGSDAGGERAATLYSLTVSCWELKLDPFRYLRDVIDRVSTTPCSEISSLTPRAWAEGQEGLAS